MTITINKRGRPKKVDKRSSIAGYTRLKKLGAERIGVMDNMLSSGTTCLEMARHIQDIWGLYTDVKELTLKRQLQRYKGNVVEPRMYAKIKIDKPKVVSTLDDTNVTHEGAELVKIGDKPDPDMETVEAIVFLAPLTADRDVMAELSELIEVQRTRVKKLYDRETSMPVLLSDMTRELSMLSSLYKDLAHLQLETGIMARVPKAITGNLAYHHNSELGMKERELNEEMSNYEEEVDVGHAVFALLSEIEDGDIVVDE